MRVFAIFRVAAKQKVRDRLGLALTLLTAPLFVLLYWLFFSDAPATYSVVVFDQEAASGVASPHGDGMVNSLKALVNSEGRSLFEVTRVSDQRELEKVLIRGEASLGLVFPLDFSAAITSGESPPTPTFVGDATSLRYRVAAALAEKNLAHYAARASGRTPALTVAEVSLGMSGSRTPFEAYVPGLLVFAVIMLIFSSSMSVVRELEAGTLSRVRLTPVSSLELLIGLSAVQLILGALSVVATFAIAFLLGFRSQGSLGLAMATAVLAGLASVGVGMFIASLARTQTRAFLLASVAMFLLVLFSGIIFPQPEVTLFEIGDRAVDLFDALPTTHMASALGKVMTLGAGVEEVTYELVFLTVVAFLNFLFGALLLARTGRPSAQVWEGLV